MKAHTDQAPPLPAAENPEVPAGLSDILMRALEKKPEARFQSADAFLQAIKNVQREPAAPRQHSSLRRPVLITVFAALTILMGAVVAPVTTRLGNAQSRALALPLPPRLAIPAAVVSSNSPGVAKTTQRRKQPRIAAARTPEKSNSALAEPASNRSEAPAAAATKTKPRNTVVKVLKRINPFQKAPSPTKDDGAN